MFYIDTEDKTIYTDIPKDCQNVQFFGSASELLGIAETKEWGKEAVTEIWNTFAGVVPFDDLKPLKKFRNRPYGVEKIWEAIQRLAPKSETVESVIMEEVKESVASSDRIVPEIEISIQELHSTEEAHAIIEAITGVSADTVLSEEMESIEEPIQTEKEAEVKKAKKIKIQKIEKTEKKGFKNHFREALFGRYRVNQLFTLTDVYGEFTAAMVKAFPNSGKYLTHKIRQTLQILRDAGNLEFVGRGQYKIVSKEI